MVQFLRIVFTTVIGGVTYTIDGGSVGASASTGTHTVAWTLPDGVKRDDCTMSAAIYTASVPSGNDYMIVDLATGDVTYEGLYATQDASNDRYNADAYKEDLLVLRKVPAGGPYPTGDSANYSSGKHVNTNSSWTTARDYYVGVFPVTQAQYVRVGLSAIEQWHTATIAGNKTIHRPATYVSWDDLRVGGTAPTEPIPAAEGPGMGGFIRRLNYMTGLYFDLPTEVMFEIAERAGVSGTYWWGSSTVTTNYVVSKEDPLTNDGTDAGKSTVAVGSKKANAWGLYDMQGNILEWCLDEKYEYDDMSSRTDVFTPAYLGGSKRSQRGAGTGRLDMNATVWPSSYRANSDESRNRNSWIGFRVYMIAD